MIIKGAGTVADDAVTSAKVADDAIDSEHYTDGSIDTAHIADNQVTVAKLEDIARGSIIVGNSSAASAELTKGSANTVLGSDGTDISYVSITSAMITDGTIATADIAADAITEAKIADDAIDSEHYTDGSIDTAHIADNQVTAAKIFDLARGSILIGNASAATAELTKGSANYVLTSDGTDIAWASASGGASQANQTAIEAETNQDTYIPPDLLRHAPGMAKGWCQYEQTGTHGIVSSYNVASVTDRGVGQTDVTWTTNFSQADYAVSVTPIANGSGSHEISEHAVDKVRTYTRDINDNSGSDAFIDVETCCIAWGDQ